MVALLVEEKVLVSTVGSESNSGNTKTREHGLEVRSLRENGVLTPGLALGPRIVVDRCLNLCLNVRLHCFRVGRRKNNGFKKKVNFCYWKPLLLLLFPNV